jgi:FkbM family methyltransferase
MFASLTRRKEQAVAVWRGMRHETHQHLLGHDVLLDRYFSSEVDYDDAWTLLLTAQASVFFDIGCNVGHTALRAGLVNPSLRMVCVDASPQILAAAARTLILNDLGARTRFVSGFVGAESDETVDFYSYDLAPGGSMFPDELAPQGVRPVRVTTTTLDDLCTQQALQPDFVKIDVEGAETQVLAGARATAAAGATFLVEMHNKGMTMQENATLVLEWCGANDVEAYYLRDHQRLTDSAVIAGRGRCHLLLLPAGREYPSGLADIPQSGSLEVAQRAIRACA